MIFTRFIFTLLTVFVVNADARCIMHGDCGTDDYTGLPKPCVYNGTAIPLRDSAAINTVKEYCPSLKTGPDFALCCDADQIKVFESAFDALATLFKRCPSCFHNLANVFCHLICSPQQNSFLELVKSSKASSENFAVDEVNYYITEHFATGLYDSCKNVQLPFTSGVTALSIACGSDDDKSCTPQKWLQYMGGHDPSSYQINFQFETVDCVTVDDATVFFPMNDTVIPCSQSVTIGGAVCSYEDCPRNFLN